MKDEDKALVESWTLSLHGLQPRTRTFYLKELDRFVRWRTDHGGGDLVAVTRRDVERWLSDLRAAGLADATIRSRYIALRNFYRWLVDEEEIDESPLAMVKVAPPVPSPVQVLGDGQIQALLKACAGKDFHARRDLAMIRLFLATGLRTSELVDLDIGDLDLPTRLVAVRHPKGGKRPRVARYDPATAAALDRYKRVRGRHRLANHPALFLGPNGRLSKAGPQIILDRRANEAGIGHVHPHQLRHTFADRFLSAGGNEGDLQQLGGWVNSDVMRRYGAARAVDRALDAYDNIDPMKNL